MTLILNRILRESLGGPEPKQQQESDFNHRVAPFPEGEENAKFRLKSVHKEYSLHKTLEFIQDLCWFKGGS